MFVEGVGIDVLSTMRTTETTINGMHYNSFIRLIVTSAIAHIGIFATATMDNHFDYLLSGLVFILLPD